MLPQHFPLGVDDLNPLGVMATLTGFVGFLISTGMILWRGMDEMGRRKRSFWWWGMLLVISYGIMIWGLVVA